MGVHLNRIYTRSGDNGTTGLGDGSRVLKHHLRVATYGTVDETGAALGLALAHSPDGPLAGLILELQNDLFDVGSDLCVPGPDGEKLRVPKSYVTRLEEHIDRLNADLGPLESFILQGGTLVAAHLHVARTVCRRAERMAIELADLPAERERVNPEVIRYLNRLSDLLFVMSRVANIGAGPDGQTADVLWRPGANS
ncbi:cob(I)yrinic acid a,c-diamide adenosyltransferase [Engelhardtia mirabilis]|uniref:Corrinoid adenosyltransferase n=1 Tax=Engelhardtia mirabilis TaxID=2528011 RepID=A0A518BR39_9BACT|nr:Cob(I)yrinic acid a,c-diamide adenosyltransferase [Planctomycetes bacterium Pla133]QDV03761.1 Cob(I)yrinic acid a,c-diamide adenosyltransferase [Planctomycetes bacterium Pla86]